MHFSKKLVPQVLRSYVLMLNLLCCLDPMFSEIICADWGLGQNSDSNSSELGLTRYAGIAPRGMCRFPSILLEVSARQALLRFLIETPFIYLKWIKN
ncbi:hypothetical protein NPIL_146671 [Nephila pilipes]|uniref:Secreted protein n=1 Tax=Nephila pilipes TaxID=299642 RepID=A0A8X6M9J8_NEPPI|nr:hypothetical protein NPIL_146671 [Nephila pilipes]